MFITKDKTRPELNNKKYNSVHYPVEKHENILNKLNKLNTFALS